MSTLTYTGSLVQTTCYCSIALAMPEDLYNWAKRTGGGVYCPLGHSFVFKDSENERLKREAASLKEDVAWYKNAEARARSDADQAQRSRAAWKGQTTKLRNRLAEGNCPYCGKFLVDLAVHVARKHPDEHPRDLTEDDAAGPA